MTLNIDWENLGFEYINASCKEEFENVINRFLSSEITEKPMLFEVFTNSKDESDALLKIRSIIRSKANLESMIKGTAKQVLGNKMISRIKKL